MHRVISLHWWEVEAGLRILSFFPRALLSCKILASLLASKQIRSPFVMGCGLVGGGRSGAYLNFSGYGKFFLMYECSLKQVNIKVPTRGPDSDLIITSWIGSLASVAKHHKLTVCDAPFSLSRSFS